MSDASFDQSRVTYFAATHTRGKARAFGIRAIDRLKHMYVIGKTGVGKSTMLENMAIQDIQNGEGIIFIDPHGSTAEKLLDFVPEERVKDVIYFDPSDTEFPLAFNIMEDVGFDQRHNVVSGLMGVFERLWADAWSARMQYILQNTLLALLEYPESTLIDVNRMLINKEFRAAVVENITDQVVKSFWVEEFANYGDRYTQEATPAIQNKVGQLVSNPLVRNIIGQPKSSFDLRKAMDERKIVICNLSKGKMGDSNSTMLGAVLVIRTYLAAMSRAKESLAVQKTLPPCYFYVDEFQNVVNKAFSNILSESRKYGLGLIIANQFIAQLNEKDSTSVKDAVFGNVGTTIVFKVGPLDAQELEPLFDPTFTIEDMVGLGVGQIYLTLSIDGITSPPFSAQTLPPIDDPEVSYRNRIIRATRENFATARADVEAFIQSRFDAYPLVANAKKSYGNNSGKSYQDSGSRAPQASSQGTVRNGTQSAVQNSAPRAATESATPRPTTRPKAPSRSPADIMRATGVVSVPPKQEDKPKPKEEKPREERTSLKDAIAAATAGVVPKETPSPMIKKEHIVDVLQTTQRTAPFTGSRPEVPEHSDEVSPEVLRRMLTDEERQ